MIFGVHCNGRALRCTKLSSASSSKQIFKGEFNLKIFLTSKKGLSCLVSTYLSCLASYGVLCVPAILDSYGVLCVPAMVFFILLCRNYSRISTFLFLVSCTVPPDFISVITSWLGQFHLIYSILSPQFHQILSEFTLYARCQVHCRNKNPCFKETCILERQGKGESIINI